MASSQRLALRGVARDARIMLRYLIALALIAIATPAAADERSYVVTNFDRIRVDGPFEVRVIVGGNGARASGSGTARVLVNLSLEVQAGTLVIRKGSNGWGEQGKVDGPAPIVTIIMPSLRAVTVIGGGKVKVSGVLRTPRFDVQLTGTGSIEASGVDAQDVVVTLIGNGSVALSGKALHARLLTNGNGSIAASDLVVGDLFVRLDGPGSTAANARFTADLTTTGIGSIAVSGNAKCRAKAPAGGPVSCGSQ